MTDLNLPSVLTAPPVESLGAVPLLLLCDAITASTGLARIAREVACSIHADPLLQGRVRVGTLGVGGTISTSSAYPFPNYSIRDLGSAGQMVPGDLPEVWLDFAGRYGDSKQFDSEENLRDREGQVRRGVLLAIWNASWCGWLARPEAVLPPGHPVREFLLQQPRGLPAAEWREMQQFAPSLAAKRADHPFERWLYCPVDGHCADGTLGWQMAEVLAGFDRVLAYTAYGARVITRTLEKWRDPKQGMPRVTLPVSYLPHGCDPAVFHPRPRDLARQTLVSRLSNGAKAVPLMPNQLLLAVVATNTQRKDWSLAFATCQELLTRGHDVLLWGHTDRLGQPGYWDLGSLARQYGMEKRVLISTQRLTDDDMAEGYCAVDAMLGIGSEGWGLPLSEALACGLPVVHMSYGGGAEFTPKLLQAAPTGFTVESPFMIQRPVFAPGDWADAVECATGGGEQGWDRTRSHLPPGLTWPEAWPSWSSWIRAGVVDL